LIAPDREVHFSSGETKSGFDIQALAGTQVVGTLLDPETHEPVAGARVTIRSSASGEQACWTDEKGKFSAAVAPGPISISDVRPPGGYFVVGNMYGASARDIEKVVSGERFALTVTMEGSLRRLGTLSGTVILPDGSPAAWCAVQTFMPPTGIHLGNLGAMCLRNVYTDQNGRFINTVFPVETEFGLYAETPDGKFAGFLPADHHETGKPVQLRLRPTARCEVAITGWEGKPLRKTNVQVGPVFGDEVPIWPAQEVRTDNEGILRLGKLLPGVTYELSAGEDTKQKVVLVSDKEEPAAPKAICLCDRYAIRLVDASGEPVGIAAFKSCKTHRINHGARETWVHSTGQLPILGRHNAEVIVPRKELLGHGTVEDIEFQIETTSGAIVSATAAMTVNATNLIEAIPVQPILNPKVEPDPAITVGAKDLAGRVIDPSGHPVQGAKITLLNAWHSPTDARIESDSEGIFRIPDVAGNPYSCLQILKEGFAPLWLADLSVGKAFRAQLHNTTRLRGKLSGLDGTASAQAEVTLFTEIYTANEHSFEHKITGLQVQGTADASGAYDVPVEPGVYRYQVAGKNGGFLQGKISVGPGEVKSLPERLQPGASVSLTVLDVQTGKPIPGIGIVIDDYEGECSSTLRARSDRTTDADGRVHWDNLRPGPTQFSASKLGYNSGPKEALLPYSRWWSDKMTNSWNRVDYKVRLPRKDEGTDNIGFNIEGDFNATILMERGVEVTGTVVDSNGNPISGCEVLAVPEEGARSSLTMGSQYTITADASGAFAGFLPAGNGMVYNLCTSTRERPFANAVSEPFQSKPGDKFQFRLQTPKGSWVTGRVVGANGKPVSAVEVQATASDYMDCLYADKICPIGPNGSFRIGPLRPGKYELRPDTVEGININPRITPAYITVEDGKDLSMVDLVFTEKE
jgi:protocatechuate 3,4-dioxygenase beta subunit